MERILFADTRVQEVEDFATNVRIDSHELFAKLLHLALLDGVQKPNKMMVIVSPAIKVLQLCKLRQDEMIFLHLDGLKLQRQPQRQNHVEDSYALQTNVAHQQLVRCWEEILSEEILADFDFDTDLLSEDCGLGWSDFRRIM